MEPSCSSCFAQASFRQLNATNQHPSTTSTSSRLELERVKDLGSGSYRRHLANTRGVAPRRDGDLVALRPSGLRCWPCASAFGSRDCLDLTAGRDRRYLRAHGRDMVSTPIRKVVLRAGVSRWAPLSSRLQFKCRCTRHRGLAARNAGDSDARLVRLFIGTAGGRTAPSLSCCTPPRLQSAGLRSPTEWWRAIAPLVGPTLRAMHVDESPAVPTDGGSIPPASTILSPVDVRGYPRRYTGFTNQRTLGGSCASSAGAPRASSTS